MERSFKVSGVCLLTKQYLKSHEVMKETGTVQINGYYLMKKYLWS